MNHHSGLRVYTGLCVAIVFVLLSARPAQAQFQPRPLGEAPSGEQYHIEGAVNPWFPGADINVASEGFGIVGTTIGFATDLGLENKALPNFRVTLRPQRRHKFRFEFTPIRYAQTTTLRRTIVFNGQRYDVGLPVTSEFDWKAYRLGYEFDVVSNDRGFAGIVGEFKYTDIRTELVTGILDEFARARAPIPAIGGIGRVYVRPNIAITGEFTGFRLPEELIQDASGYYADFDLYGTFNFNPNVGTQFGYRSLDLGYVFETDTGDLTLKGLYVGIVARY